MTQSKARVCGDKHRHETKESALEQYWSLVRSGTHPAAMRVYRCKFCQCWHVGHRMRRR